MVKYWDIFENVPKWCDLRNKAEGVTRRIAHFDLRSTDSQVMPVMKKRTEKVKYSAGTGISPAVRKLPLLSSVIVTCRHKNKKTQIKHACFVILKSTKQCMKIFITSLTNNKQAQKLQEMEMMRNVTVSSCSVFAWKGRSAAAIPEDKMAARFASAYWSAGGFAQQTGHKD